MQIVTPFLQMLERYNGMMMEPASTDALEEAVATAPLEDLFEATPQPALTLVASR